MHVQGSFHHRSIPSSEAYAADNTVLLVLTASFIITASLVLELRSFLQSVLSIQAVKLQTRGTLLPVRLRKTRGAQVVFTA